MMMEKQLCAPVGASSPYVAPTPSPYPLATPSPFSLSIVSTSVSTNPPCLHLAKLILRGSALFFSLAAVLTLALAFSPTNGNKGSPCSTFSHSSGYWYSLSIATISFIYSAFQLIKGICDTVSRGLFVSEKRFDYATFMLDQLVAYLLMSASSSLIPSAMEIVVLPCGKLAAASAGMSLLPSWSSLYLPCNQATASARELYGRNLSMV